MTAAQIGVVKLSEPSDVVLEHILLGTSRSEQFAIAGRVSAYLGFRLVEGSVADYGVKSRRFMIEARRRGIAPDALVELIVARVIAGGLLAGVLDQ